MEEVNESYEPNKIPKHDSNSRSDINVAEILTTWRKLVGIFGRMKFLLPTVEDQKLSIQTMTSSNDHVSFALKSSYWIESNIILDELEVEEIQLLGEISGINLAHIEKHQKFSYAVLVFIGSLFTFGITQFSDTITVAFYLIPLIAGIAIVLAVIWVGSWKAFELDTCISLNLKRRLAEERLRQRKAH